MACFLVPMALAIITSILQKTVRGLSEKLGLWKLNVMLWGGVIILAFEHIWHGEVVPWPPFLTAMSNPADIPVMLNEMATIGSTMSIAILFTWTLMLTTSKIIIPRLSLYRFKHLEEAPKAPRI